MSELNNKIIQKDKIAKAVDFATKAHEGQTRVWRIGSFFSGWCN